jgi:hypothetical protein
MVFQMGYPKGNANSLSSEKCHNQAAAMLELSVLSPHSGSKAIGELD